MQHLQESNRNNWGQLHTKRARGQASSNEDQGYDIDVITFIYFFVILTYSKVHHVILHRKSKHPKMVL